MTREETIKWLDSLKTEISKPEHRTLWHYAEAIDMVIQALSADDDLIRREDAIKKMITDNLVGGIDEFNAYKDKVVVSEWLDCLRDCVFSLEDVPSVSLNRPTAEWIDGKCSECGHHAPYWAMASTYYESYFCPNCGARMRGEDE